MSLGVIFYVLCMYGAVGKCALGWGIGAFFLGFFR